jgi:NAD(P)-dependent dehydrogenase (short-subunit alcohol dehydrogenase family)
MAKAALNMLTRTSAEDLAKTCRIYMNSVDTGWITNEYPLAGKFANSKYNKFQPPIDEIDAAARILDPIFIGIKNGRDGRKVYGKFLKDYKESEW